MLQCHVLLQNQVGSVTAPDTARVTEYDALARLYVRERHTYPCIFTDTGCTIGHETVCDGK